MSCVAQWIESGGMVKVNNPSHSMCRKNIVGIRFYFLYWLSYSQICMVQNGIRSRDRHLTISRQVGQAYEGGAARVMVGPRRPSCKRYSTRTEPKTTRDLPLPQTRESPASPSMQPSWQKWPHVPRTHSKAEVAGCQSWIRMTHRRRGETDSPSICMPTPSATNYVTNIQNLWIWTWKTEAQLSD